MSLRNRKQTSQNAGTWLLSDMEADETIRERQSPHTRHEYPYPEFSFGFDDLRQFCEDLLMKLRKLLESVFSTAFPLSLPAPISPDTTNLMNQFRSFVQTPYDSSCDIHEQTLLKYWELCCPSTPLESRKSEQWKSLGFQGIDPATDIRGGGIFGLRCLVYFAATYPQTFADMRTGYVADTQERYPFSIAGLNILMSVYDLLGWGFKRTPQDPLAARSLISLLFESDIVMDCEPVKVESPIVNPQPIVDLLTDTVQEYQSTSHKHDLLSFNFSTEEEKDELDFSTFDELPDETIFSVNILFQHDEGTPERISEKIIFEMFCFCFHKLHQNWMGRPSVGYMDFPIVLKDTAQSISDYLKQSNPSPQKIQTANESANIPL